MANNDNTGIVYLLTNECMPGLVKIGMTSKKDMDDRLKELYTTGVPMPFDCVYACKVDCFKELERALHDAFEPHRVNPSREFFRIKPSQVLGILRLFDKGNMTAEVVKEMENDIPEEEQKAIRRRKPIDFFEMGFKEGDVLTFEHDSTFTCTIKSNRKVLFKGEEFSLTALTTKLLGTKNSVQPTPHWAFNEKNLTDIYEEWQKSLNAEEGEVEYIAN